jgi:hypothetical protein
MALTAE